MVRMATCHQTRQKQERRAKAAARQQENSVNRIGICTLAAALVVQALVLKREVWAALAAAATVDAPSVATEAMAR
jgi:hypothetical protein